MEKRKKRGVESRDHPTQRRTRTRSRALKVEEKKNTALTGANLDVQGQYGDTALIITASKGHTEIVMALVGAGANLDVQDEDGDTALILAASKGHTEIVKALAGAGANLGVHRV